jgi:amidase
MLITTRKLFFQTGFKEGQAILDSAGEERMPGVAFTLKTFQTQPLSITELFACNTQQSGWKGAMSQWWTASSSLTRTGRPIDAIIGPTSAAAGAPHDMPGYCGYTSVWNILDYPAATLPLKGFKISADKDPKEAGYQPLTSNPYDEMVYEMYDPDVLAQQPVCLQVVGRPFQDEEVVAVTEALDLILNP